MMRTYSPLLTLFITVANIILIIVNRRVDGGLINEILMVCSILYGISPGVGAAEFGVCSRNLPNIDNNDNIDNVSVQSEIMLVGNEGTFHHGLKSLLQELHLMRLGSSTTPLTPGRRTSGRRRRKKRGAATWAVLPFLP
jgi:hypothetical protein